jgi:hypothetical protein
MHRIGMKSSNFDSMVFYDMAIKTIVVPNLDKKNKIFSLEFQEQDNNVHV